MEGATHPPTHPYRSGQTSLHGGPPSVYREPPTGNVNLRTTDASLSANLLFYHVNGLFWFSVPSILMKGYGMTVTDILLLYPVDRTCLENHAYLKSDPKSNNGQQSHFHSWKLVRRRPSLVSKWLLYQVC